MSVQWTNLDFYLLSRPVSYIKSDIWISKWKVPSHAIIQSLLKCLLLTPWLLIKIREAVHSNQILIFPPIYYNKSENSREKEFQLTNLDDLPKFNVVSVVFQHTSGLKVEMSLNDKIEFTNISIKIIIETYVNLIWFTF